MKNKYKPQISGFDYLGCDTGLFFEKSKTSEKGLGEEEANKHLEEYFCLRNF